MNRACVLFAALVLAASAHASYGQMRLDGAGLMLAFALVVVYGVIVDACVLVRLFRYRLFAIIAGILSVATAYLFLLAVASPAERAGFFKGPPGGAALVVIAVTSAAFLPFILVAPFAQHLALRRERPSPRWLTAWMLLHVALLPIFVALAGTEHYFWERDFAAGQAEGRKAVPGGLGRILEQASQGRERIWGTGFRDPWQHLQPASPIPSYSAWVHGLAKGLGESALLSADEPLRAPDQAQLRTLMDRHFSSHAAPGIRAKLVWDALEPGRFARYLPPEEDGAAGRVPEQSIPLLLERLEKPGAARLCPGGRMLEEDRAALHAMVRKRGRAWSTDTRTEELRADWRDFPARIDRLCGGKAG